MMFGSLLIRGGALQVNPSERLAKRYERQFTKVMNVEGRRGYIYDREGRQLAASVIAYSLYADPKMLEKPRAVSKKLAKILPEKWTEIYKKLKNKKRRFVWLGRRLDTKLKDQIKAWNYRGLGFIEEPKRIYPNESLLANVLGFVGSSSQGLGGTEVRFEEILNGTGKSLKVDRDARGRPLFINGLLFNESPDGHNLHLTIDNPIQYQLEAELKSSVEKFEASGAVGVILNAETSEVVAMASYPSFNPNDPLKYSAQNRRNRSVTDPFESGSTMKAITIASALQEKIAKPESTYFCENGSFKIGRRTIRESDRKHQWKWMSVSDILKKSSNIGTTKIAFELGDDTLRRRLLDFGFGAKTSDDFTGESRGILPKLPWNKHLLSNISFGHGLAVTPLQVANAYAAIANGGQLHKPYLVSKITDAEGRLVETKKPEVIRRVLSPEVSQQMRTMLGHVTEDGGTAKTARVEGFPVGGKTGTAQKINPETGTYEKGGYVSSFAGIIPLDRPKLVIYIAVDAPQTAYYATDVAAPTFARVASFAARHYGWKPSAPLKENSKIKLAKKKSSKIKHYQSKQKRALAAIESKLAEQKWTKMPNLKGLSLREVMRDLRRQGLDADIYGSGNLSKSIPEVGASLENREKVKLYFK